jgi:hypothetical protein
MLMDNYPDTFVAVEYHLASYTTAWGNNRRYFYPGYSGTPWCWFDGTVEALGSYGNVSQDYNRYRTIYLQEREAPTDVTLDLCVRQLCDATHRITAKVGLEPGGANKSVRLHIAAVLDNYPYGSQWHNTFRQIAPRVDIPLTAGEHVYHQVDLIFGPTDWTRPDDIKIVAWAQDTRDNGPADIYQAAWVGGSYPFPKDLFCAGDMDYDDVRDLTDFSLFAAAYGASQCSPSYFPEADIDGDGEIDLTDFTHFASGYLIPCP